MWKNIEKKHILSVIIGEQSKCYHLPGFPPDSTGLSAGSKHIAV